MKDTDENKTGVVVVTYNNAAQLETLLSDLNRQTLRPSEVIVIDNASSDNTREIVARSGIPIRYVRNDKNLGSAGGYREGIRLASESNDFIWLLDDDVELASDALENIVQGMKKLAASEKIGVARSWSNAPFPLKTPARLKNGFFAWRGTLIRKEVVDAVGLPRNEYFFYGDDVEYSLRIRKNGYSAYWIPESCVIEKPADSKVRLKFFGHQTTVNKEPFRLYYAHRNQINIFLEYRYFKGLLETFVYSVKLLVFFTFFYRKGSFERNKAIIIGIWDGICGHLGINGHFVP